MFNLVSLKSFLWAVRYFQGFTSHYIILHADVRDHVSLRWKQLANGLRGFRIDNRLFRAVTMSLDDVGSKGAEGNAASAVGHYT